jgi:hypothetical protein
VHYLIICLVSWLRNVNLYRNCMCNVCFSRHTLQFTVKRQLIPTRCIQYPLHTETFPFLTCILSNNIISYVAFYSDIYWFQFICYAVVYIVLFFLLCSLLSLSRVRQLDLRPEYVSETANKRLSSELNETYSFTASVPLFIILYVSPVLFPMSALQIRGQI